MKNKKYFIISAMTLLCTVSAFADFAESLSEIEKVMNSINSVFTAVTQTFSAINSLFGIEVILLLLAVIVFSSGLSSVGMPKGKLAFFTSLLLADFFWVIWITAQKPESGIFVLKIIKTNLILLSPYLLILSIKTIFPIIKQNIYRKIYVKKGMKKDALLRYSEEIMQLHLYLSKHIQHDLAEDTEYVVLSQKSVNSLIRLTNKLNSLKKYHRPAGNSNSSNSQSRNSFPESQDMS